MVSVVHNEKKHNLSGKLKKVKKVMAKVVSIEKLVQSLLMKFYRNIKIIAKYNIKMGKIAI